MANEIKVWLTEVIVEQAMLIGIPLAMLLLYGAAVGAGRTIDNFREFWRKRKAD